MKTYKNLWVQIITKENFDLAYKNARKGKTRRRDVREFEKDAERKLEEIRQSVINKTFTTSEYRHKEIFEPKKRTIYILPFQDRIVQHAIMNILAPLMEKLFIKDSYACISGRGQHKASMRTMQAIRRNKYCLKCDIRKFYPSINQSILSKMFHEKIRDKDLLFLLDDIIFSFPGEKNVPIGNYTSQWFGNFYLTKLDMYVKHTLKIKDYIRYCDDFMLFGNDKKYLHYCRVKIQEFLLKELELEYSKSDVFNVKQGVDFCGYRHFRNYILLRKSTAKRQLRKVRKLAKLYQENRISKEKLRSKVESVRGWIKHAKTHNLQIAMDLEVLRRVYA